MNPHHYRPISMRDMLADLRRSLPGIRQMATSPLRFAGRQAHRLSIFVRLLPFALTKGGGVLGALLSARRVMLREGLVGLKRALRRIHDEMQGPDATPTAVQRRVYRDWILQYDMLSADDRAGIRAHVADMRDRPLISVVMPVYDPHPTFLDQAIQSVRDQLYPCWELCIADDASTNGEIRRVIERHRTRDSRIKVDYRKINGHICHSTNSALSLAQGEFIALLDHDDILSEHALYWIAAELEHHPTADILFSDSDLIDDLGERFAPYFKSDFNLELMLGHNMVSHLGVYRRSLVDLVGGMRVGLEGSQDYDLLLRAFAKSRVDRVRHIPAVLYHWRRSDKASSFSTTALDRCVRAAQRAVGDFLRDKDIAADVIPAPELPHFQRVAYHLPDPAPTVSVIIPTRNRARLLERCVRGVLSATDYPSFDVTIIDNDSDDADAAALLAQLAKDPRVRVISYPGAFNFAAVNNHAVSQTNGAMLAFLNNDIQVTHADWLREMVCRAAQPDVGAVGAKLYDSHGNIQHAGIVTGLGDDRVAGHSYRTAPRHSTGSFGDLLLAREVSAVTCACMVVRRSAFLEAGGLDEVNLAAAYNDVDFCLRLRERGYRNILTPFAQLIHHESATRGSEISPERRDRFLQEAAYMKLRWGDLLLRDPYFNPNYSLDSAVPAYAQPPRIPYPWRSRGR